MNAPKPATSRLYACRVSKHLPQCGLSSTTIVISLLEIRTHFTNIRECERGYLGGSARRVVQPRVVPLASGATQQYAQIARSLRVLARKGAGRVVLLANSSLLAASHALPAPFLARTHLTDIGEMSSSKAHGCDRRTAAAACACRAAGRAGFQFR